MVEGFKGMPELIARVKKIPDDLKAGVKNLVADTSQQIVIDAVNNLRANGSTNYGALMQSVNSIPKNNGFGQEIVAATEYAPAVEWGTKTNFSLGDHPELEAYAAQFKGTPSGGTWDQFLAAILDWVKKKGIGISYSVKTHRRTTATGNSIDSEQERIAFLIARSIYKKGVTARPFFFPAWFRNTADFEKKLTEMFKRVVG